MKRFDLLLVVFLAGAPALSAQALRPAPAEAVDATHARVRDALVMLRDTLNLVDAAVGRMQRDVARSSDAVLVSRSRTLRDRCQRGAVTASSVGRTATEAGLPSPDPKRRLVQLRSALDSLQAALTECEKVFGEMSAAPKAEELRGYAVSRALKAQSAIRRYESAHSAQSSTCCARRR